MRAARDVTITDVAARAGVSITTVSHALSGNRPVADATRERIERAIRELGYRPNAFARGLRTERSYMVSLIVPDLTNPYYPALARGMQDVLMAAGYQTFVCSTDGNEVTERRFLENSLERRADGIAFASFSTVGRSLASVLPEGTAIVSIGCTLEHPKVDCVQTDDYEGAREATRYLVARGYAPIGMISGPPGTPPSDNRQGGHRAALREAGIRFHRRSLAVGDFTRAGGARAMKALLSRSERPRAVFCANDLMAIGAIDAAREARLRVPRDIAIVGYDDIEAATLITPALATVLNPAHDIGRACGRLLLERMSGVHRGRRRHIVVPHRFVPRASA